MEYTILFIIVLDPLYFPIRINTIYHGRFDLY